MSQGGAQELAALDDGAVAARIAAAAPDRDPDAEQELCRRLAPRIRLYGLKHLREESGARDLMQDVLVMMLEKLRAGAVRDPAQIASFALGTARQRVLDLRRGERRRAALRDAFVMDLQPQVDEADPVLGERLSQCLAALTERERSVILMTFYEDRGAEALARELGLSAGNVRVIRHRALDRLRTCLDAREGAA